MAKTAKMQEVSLSKLVPYERNAKIHGNFQIQKLKASIEEFGFLTPCLIDRDFNIIAGHGRVMAAKELGMTKVPCVFVEGLTDEQRRAYILADNRLGDLGEWDMEMVTSELVSLKDADFDVTLTGFDMSIEVGADTPAEVVEDEVPDPPAEPVTKLGDIWQLGEHRLMCGDATSASDFGLLMDGALSDMVFTDPPYNVAIGSKNAFLNSVQKAGRCTEDIMGDKGMTDTEIGESLWKPSFQNLADFAKDECSIYVTMPQGGTHMMMMMMMADASWQVKHELIWLKNAPTFSMGRLDYDYKHEPIMYGWKKTHKYYGKGNFTKSVWEIDKPRESKLHPTMKPIELIANALLNSSQPGDVVADAFGGSGSTLIACEQTGRKCYMMELDPHYCDVIVQRWENLTGKKGVLLHG